MGIKEIAAKVAKRIGFVEILDPTPVAMPAGYTAQEPLDVRVRRILRDQGFQNAMNQQGLETFDEATDFNDPEEEEMLTGYEVEYDPNLGRDAYRQESQKFKKHLDEFDEMYIKARRKHYAARKKVKKKASEPKKEA